MLKNYLKISLRNLRRQFGFSLINLVGLAVGLACCILVLLHVQDELSYDRFLDDVDNIYRIKIDAKIGEQEILAPLSPAPMAAALETSFPEVKSATRIFRSDFVGADGVRIARGEDKFTETKFFYVDSTFFDVFSFQVLAGDKQTALSQPNALVLTEETAARYFGTEDPINKVLRINNQTDYLVTAVIENIPDQSHWHFDILASISSVPISQSMQWISNPFTTYLKVTPDHDVAALNAKIQSLVDSNVSDQFQSVLGVSAEQFAASGGRYNFSLQPLNEIYLHSQLQYELEPNGSISYVYIFSVVALLILLIACFNFMNLSTARSANRAKEVGIRKALGSHRKQLITQFLFESILLCSLALILALFVVKMVLPVFNDLLGKNIEVVYFSGYFMLTVVGFVLMLGLVAGAYPAFFLTSFESAGILKGAVSKGTKNGRLRSGLVVLQFTISIALMIGAATVYQQVDYVQNKRLGFEKDLVVIVEQAASLGARRETFKNELMAVPGVIKAAGLGNLPGGTLGDDTFRTLDASIDQLQVTWMVYGDTDVIEALDMEVVEGRQFSKDAPRDSAALILNQTAVHQLGLEDPIGEQLVSPFSAPGQPDRIFSVVGVLSEVHFESLHEEIKPLAIELVSETSALPFLAIRLKPGDVANSLAAVEAAWNEFLPGESFQYTFLDQYLTGLYQSDLQTGRLVGIFAGLAIFIACLGLFGLAAFVAESRIREVGIRKVLGASVPGIVRLFTHEFLKLVMIAFVIAAPIAFIAMQKWLEIFAYRIEVSFFLFFVVGLVAVLIAFATVGYQAVRAALINPVEALRSE